MVGIKNLSVTYGENEILSGVNLTVNAGEVVCVLGASGIGKTTLLNAIAGLIPYGGEITGAKRVSYVFQSPRLIGDLTVFKNVKFVAENKSDQEVYAALKLAGIEHKLDAKTRTLSGGEKQRVQIARAVLADAPVFLFDEPFSSLDTAIKKSLLKIVKDLAKVKGKSIIFVTHDVFEAAVLSDTLAFISGGGLTTFKFTEDLTEAQKLNKIYEVLSLDSRLYV